MTYDSPEKYPLATGYPGESVYKKSTINVFFVAFLKNMFLDKEIHS